jgi:3-phenylpropionate/cinnamic acid dioxygenase small subunit
MPDILEEKEAIRDVLQQAGALLDAEAFGEWIDLFVEGALYEVRAYSTEIGVDMEWMKLNREELQALLEQAPEHVRDLAQRLHLVSPITVALHDKEASSVSSFAIFRTTRDGVTQCYAVGQYEDTLVKREGVWRFLQRTVRLHTRLLETATHVPF